MAYYGFAQKILLGQPIEVFGEGRMARDFTYIDDIVDGVVGVLDRPPAGGENRLLNIGDCNPVGLMDMIAMLERKLGRPAIKLMRPMQRSEEHTSELQSLMRISYAVFRLTKQTTYVL